MYNPTQYLKKNNKFFKKKFLIILWLCIYTVYIYILFNSIFKENLEFELNYLVEQARKRWRKSNWYW